MDKVNGVRVSLALDIMGSIWSVAEKAIMVRAEKAETTVWIIFNELPVPVCEGDTVEMVCAKYDEMRERHHYAPAPCRRAI